MSEWPTPVFVERTWDCITICMKKKFLPNVSKNRLRKMEKNEKDPKAKMILLACIAKKRK